MLTKQLNDLLSLLALTVVADKKVYSQEIEVFLYAATSLQKELGLMPALGHKVLLAWFSENRDSLTATLSSGMIEQVLGNLLTRLSGLPNKSVIIDKMIEISVADDEVHVSEKALMVLAARHWQIMPKNLEKICRS